MASVNKIDDVQRLVVVTKDLLKMFLAANQTDTKGDGHRLLVWLAESCRHFQTYRHSRVFNSGRTNNLLLIMRECLLTHRWTAALRVLVSIVQRPAVHANYERTMLLVLLELCFQLSIEPDRFLFLMDANRTDCSSSIEYFLFSVACNRDISTCMAPLKPSQPARYVRLRSGQSNSHDKLLRRAYRGLMSYADYMDCQLRSMDDLLSEDLRMRALMSFEDAKTQWEGLAGVPGVWDVFIVKYVDLLERENNIGQCEEVLITYKDTCMVRPNGLRLLYSFYVRHGWSSSQNALDVLAELCTLIESDDLVLDYYRTLSDTAGRIGLLFNLLDYATSRSNVQAWNYLCKELASSVVFDPDCEPNEAVCQCWAIRADWWPEYHFSVGSLPDVLLDEHLDLVAFKAAASYYLCGVDNRYTHTVAALLRLDFSSASRKSFRRLDRLLNQ